MKFTNVEGLNAISDDLIIIGINKESTYSKNV